MRRLSGPWRLVVSPHVIGWDAIVGERMPRRKKHHMRTRRLALRKLDYAWLQAWAKDGLAAQEVKR